MAVALEDFQLPTALSIFERANASSTIFLNYSLYWEKFSNELYRWTLHHGLPPVDSCALNDFSGNNGLCTNKSLPALRVSLFKQLNTCRNGCHKMLSSIMQIMNSTRQWCFARDYTLQGLQRLGMTRNCLFLLKVAFPVQRTLLLTLCPNVCRTNANGASTQSQSFPTGLSF